MLRKLSSKLHLYLGLVAGLLLVPIGLSGSILIFHDEIDTALHPGLLRVVPQERRAAVDDVVAALRQAFPDEEPERLEIPQAPEEVYEVVLSGAGRSVYIDPYSGRLLGSRLPHESLTGFLFEIHTKLLAGRQGEILVGLVGLVLLVIGLTGLVLWWRGLKQVGRGFRVRWRASRKRVNYDLHSALGIYTVLPLFVLALTGSALIFFPAFSRLTHTLTGTPQPPPPQSTYEAALPSPSLDLLLARAGALLPTARLSRIDFPAGPRGTFRVRLKLPEEIHPIGLSMVYFDRYSGAVLRVIPAPEVPPAGRLGHWLYPIHIGTAGGLPMRLLWVFVGLAPALLLITGFFIWRWPGRKSPPVPPARAVPTGRKAKNRAAPPSARVPHRTV